MKVNKKVVLLCLRALVPYFLTRPNRVHLCRRNVLAKLRFITSKISLNLTTKQCSLGTVKRILKRIMIPVFN